MNTAVQIYNNPASFGRNGGYLIQDTNVYSGGFYVLIALEDSTINSGTFTSGSNWSGNLSGLALSAGTPLYMPIDNFSLSAGSVLAYLD